MSAMFESVVAWDHHPESNLLEYRSVFPSLDHAHTHLVRYKHHIRNVRIQKSVVHLFEQ